MKERAIKHFEKRIGEYKIFISSEDRAKHLMKVINETLDVLLIEVVEYTKLNCGDIDFIYHLIDKIKER